MRRRGLRNQRGVTLIELIVVVGMAGAVVLVGLSSFYVATVRAFSNSTSQTALQPMFSTVIRASSTSSN